MAQFRCATMLLLFGWMIIGQSLNTLAADRNLQILNFSMDRCEPCKAMQPVLAKLIMEGWQIRQIDVGVEPQMVAQFKLESVPTLVMLSGGRELDRIKGTIPYNKLLAHLEAASRAAKQTSPSPTEPQGRPEQGSAPFRQSPQPLAQRSPPSEPAFEPSMVRGQSPGPADVPDLDIDNDRMLDFVKDLPEAPNFATANTPTQPAIGQLASSTANIGRAAIQQMNPATNNMSAQPAQHLQANAPQTAQPAYDPMARAQQATVRIRIEDANSIAFGTGTVIYVHNGQALVLTCGHMFRDLSPGAQMSIDVFDKAGRATNVPAQVVSHSTEEGDIGLMEFRCPYPITPIPIAKRAPTIGEAAFSFGCDRGADPTRRDTQVKRINRYLGPANVEIHGAPVVGRSGGGLFNAQGQLIGVCNAADAEDDEGIYAALPVIEQHVAALRLEALPTDVAQATPTPNPVQFASTNNVGSSLGGMAPIQPAQATQSALSAMASASTQVRCVIRDAQGKETALLIERPSEELVAMLRQSATR